MIVNLTQHPATPEQIAAGVYDPTPEERAEIAKLLTFEELPDKSEIEKRAYQLALTAYTVLSHRQRQMTHEEQEMEAQYGRGMCAMIGGAPYLMSALERALADMSVCALYAFSKRESVEEALPDGGVRKVNVFRHQGFVSAF